MSSKFLIELSNDYEKLFETEIGYDVIIYAGEEPNIKEIHVHSNILCIRSKYFILHFLTNGQKNLSGWKQPTHRRRKRGKVRQAGFELLYGLEDLAATAVNYFFNNLGVLPTQSYRH